MLSQRELRTRKYPLLERIERMNQKEIEFGNEILPISKNKLFLIEQESEPINQKIKPIKFFTKLALLNNKRRYR